ncbi:Pre-mrna-splicing factor cwc22 [Favolaschia claudopus]|uniref:Pre-mrna-splicing factor cwc22 n=1 Tax=Favolaschia claudopus TaxID=2862362 RepID=A0AAW0DCP8_9AGAR
MSTTLNISSRGGRTNNTRSRPGANSQSSAPRRKMELIASVSRSSGLQKDGDDLKNLDVQNEYWDYIAGKLNDLWENYPRRVPESETQTRQRIDVQENVLILFRKLREGIIASRRVDSFALEVYETSLFLAILFDSPRHIGPVIPALTTYFHLPSTQPYPTCAETILVCLLHYLVAAHPSQREFHASLASMPNAFFPGDSAARIWITSLAGCIRSRNYAKLGKLTQITALPGDDARPESDGPGRPLSRKALYHLVDSLRSKTREMTWIVMRAAYRELFCQVDSHWDTRSWLERSLGLSSKVPGGHSLALDEWLISERDRGHVREKEGLEGRWIVCKPR